MIIVWRGLGVLAVLLPALVAFAANAASRSLGDRQHEGITLLGAALGGLVVFALGRRLNQPKADVVDEYRQRRSAELHHLVENGAFQGLPGGAAPTSLEEARSQAAQLLDAEVDQVRRGTRNRHTLFWIPMQWIGAVVVAWGIVSAVVLLATG